MDADIDSDLTIGPFSLKLKLHCWCQPVALLPGPLDKELGCRLDPVGHLLQSRSVNGWGLSRTDRRSETPTSDTDTPTK